MFSVMSTRTEYRSRLAQSAQHENGANQILTVHWYKRTKNTHKVPKIQKSDPMLTLPLCSSLDVITKTFER